METAAFRPKLYFSESEDVLEDDDDPNPKLKEIITHKSVWLNAIVDDVIMENIGSMSGSRKRRRVEEESESELSLPLDSSSFSDKEE